MLDFNEQLIDVQYMRDRDFALLKRRHSRGEALISKSIRTVLIYACRFWAEHLKDSPRSEPQLRTVQPLLNMLLHEKLLYLLEVLSLVKAVPSVKESLMAAADFLRCAASSNCRRCACLKKFGSQGHDDGIAEVAKDASKFARTFEEPIACRSHPYLHLRTVILSL